MRTLVTVSTTSAVLEEILMLETMAPAKPPMKPPSNAADIGAAGIAVLGGDVGHQDVVGGLHLAAADIGAALQRAAGRQRAFLLRHLKTLAAVHQGEAAGLHHKHLQQGLGRFQAQAFPPPVVAARAPPGCRSCGCRWEFRPASGRSCCAGWAKAGMRQEAANDRHRRRADGSGIAQTHDAHLHFEKFAT